MAINATVSFELWAASQPRGLRLGGLDVIKRPMTCHCGSAAEATPGMLHHGNPSGSLLGNGDVPAHKPRHFKLILPSGLSFAHNYLFFCRLLVP